MIGSSLMRLSLVLLVSFQTVTAAPAAEQGKDPNASTAAPDQDAAVLQYLKNNDGKVLADLPCLRLVVEPSNQSALAAGLTESALKSTVLVGVRNKISRLRVDESCETYLYVNLNFVSSHYDPAGRPLGFAANIALEIDSNVTIGHNHKFTHAPIWERSTLIVGSPESAKRQVTEQLDGFVTEFAGKYYEDGNP